MLGKKLSCLGIALLSPLLGFTAASAHLGDDCVALGGVVEASECRISTPVTATDLLHGGPFTISETLHITGTGSITVPDAIGGNALTLQITGGLIIDAPTLAGGGQITGNAVIPSAVGARITIHATGDIVLHGSGTTGALISADHPTTCPTPLVQSGVSGGGDITLEATGSITTEAGSAITSDAMCRAGEIRIIAGREARIDGLVSSHGTTANGRGNPITVNAGCDLTVGSAGRITSKGRDPGADLVHLQGGCSVTINGLVQSTGPGHQHKLDRLCHGPNRPDKPAQSPACVEVWSGGNLTINSKFPNNGEINADTAQIGGILCCPWIDLYAVGAIHIDGDDAAPFSVHANQFRNDGFGGLITLKSTEDSVSAQGLAIQAVAPQSGGQGGRVLIEAAGAVSLDKAQIIAQGDAVATNRYGVGGIVEVRAFTGSLSWTNLAGGVAAIGDVQPTGLGVPSGKRGTVTLNSCGPVNTTGTLFPMTTGAATTPAQTAGLCPPAGPDAPDLPDYVQLPACVCEVPSDDPDVSVVKVTTTPSISAGSTASYGITVTAGGTATSTNVTLTDIVPGPASMSWAVNGADALACSPRPVAGGSTLTCLFGDMPQGSTKSISLSATTSGANCPSINNTATVSATIDSNPGNNTSGPITIAVACAPDVSISKSTTTPSISVGETASYSITVTAGGTGASINVNLTDVLPGPASMSWAVTGPAAASCSPNPVAGGGTLLCAFGTMSQGSTRSITLSARARAASCPSLANTATVSADADSNTSNNAAGPVTIAVACAPDVSIAKSTTTPSIAAGATASYSITVTAGGTGKSSDVQLTDVLPGPASMSWAVTGDGAASCSPNPVAGGSTLLCAFGTMTQGSTKSITLTAATTFANCPSIVNTAMVTATRDTNTGNNSAGPVPIAVICPDISVEKSTTTPTVVAGGTASYTISVTAKGPGSSANVTLTDVLPSGPTWTVGGASAAACTPASPVAGGTTLTCNFGTMVEGTTATITLTGTTQFVWEFKKANRVVGTAAGANYKAADGTTIRLNAFVGSTSTSNGTPAFMYGKDAGAGEQGAGICASASGSPLVCNDTGSAHEVDTNEDGFPGNNNGLLRINLGALAASTVSSFTVVMDSVQPGETFQVYTNSIDTINGATLLHTGTAAEDGMPVPLAGVQRYLFLKAGAGDVLLNSLSASICGHLANTAVVGAAGDNTPGNNSSGPIHIGIICH